MSAQEEAEEEEDTDSEEERFLQGRYEVAALQSLAQRTKASVVKCGDISGKTEGMMRVRVTNKFSNNYDKVGIADETAWDRDDFWIPVTINGERHLIAKIDLVEA